MEKDLNLPEGTEVTEPLKMDLVQLHDILLLRTSAILPEAISAGGLTPTTDTSLFLTTYRGGSHLPADILYMTLYQSSDNLSTHFLL